MNSQSKRTTAKKCKPRSDYAGKHMGHDFEEFGSICSWCGKKK